MKTKSRFGEAVRSLAAEADSFRFSNFDEKKDLRFKTYKNIFKEYVNNFNKELFSSSNKEPFEYL